MNQKIVLVCLVVVICAVSAQCFKLGRYGPGCGCGPCDCDDCCGPCYDDCCGYPCAPPCPHTVHVSPVVGLLSKIKAKVVSKILDKYDDCGWGHGGCGCGGYGWKGGKKCKWLHSPYLDKTVWAANKFC